MPIATPKITENDVSVEINLEKLLGPVAKNDAIREVFFQTAFDQMLERLDKGIDVDGKSLGKYSKAYKNSLEFQSFRKSDTVNMQLTSEMVNSLAVQNDSPTKFKIGFTGDFNNTKAFAHMTGYAGHPVLAGKVKPRNFFGWSDKTLKQIAADIGPFQGTKEDITNQSQILNLLTKLTS